jgi:multidrug efflux pump subunit AcrB
MRLPLAFIVSTLVLSAPVQAELLYVADKLVLNVYAEADQSSSRVATIETGDAVEALERSESFVRVQLNDGQAGWVGANYLVEQPPAIVRLKELQNAPSGSSIEPAKPLTEDIARLKKQNASLQSELADLKKRIAAVPAPPVSAVSAAMEIVPPELAAVSSTEPPPAPTIIVERSFWWAWLIAVFAAASGGFLAGYQTLGRRVRERFGGVKVY